MSISVGFSAIRS